MDKRKGVIGTKKFSDETFLKLFKGSLSQANPLKRFKWVSEPESSLKTVKAVKGEFFPSGVLRLIFEIGIRMEIEGVRHTLINEGKECGRPCQFGYGSQYAYWHYLNYFSEFSSFRFQYDCVFGSSYNKPADFRIFFPDYDFWLEVKSAPPNMECCRYFVTQKNYSYPEWVVCVKCLDEEMLKYEIYGFCSGSHVQEISRELIHGFPCHQIPLNREHFKSYNDFHENILKLPYVENFDNDHYV